MASHSKTTGGRSVFSHYERELMKAGTRQVVLGKDSIKNFDDCTICLNPAVSPVCCLKGHIFCKECAYQNILRQKKELKARQAEHDRVEAKRLQKQRTDEAMKREALADTLTKIDFGILEASAPASAVRTDNVQMKLPSDKARGTVACFWIPSQCPSADGDPDKVKSGDGEEEAAAAAAVAVGRGTSGPVCPASEGEKTHPFRLKSLVAILFTEAADQKEMDEGEERRRGKAKGPKKPRYQCPMCLKTLTNSTQCALPKACGHVMCRGCVDLLMKATEEEDRGSNNSKGAAPRCYVCQHPFTRAQVINLQVGGTGFSGHGDNLTVKSYAPAPRV